MYRFSFCISFCLEQESVESSRAWGNDDTPATPLLGPVTEGRRQGGIAAGMSACAVCSAEYLSFYPIVSLRFSYCDLSMRKKDWRGKLGL